MRQKGGPKGTDQTWRSYAITHDSMIGQMVRLREKEKEMSKTFFDFLQVFLISFDLLE